MIEKLYGLIFTAKTTFFKGENIFDVLITNDL